MNDDGPRLSRPRFTRHALLLNCLFPTRQDEDETRPADTVLCLPQARPPEDTKLLLIFGFTGQQMHHMHVRREQSRVGVTCSACRPCNRSDAFQIVVRVTHPSVAATADELTQAASPSPTDRPRTRLLVLAISSDRVTIWVGSRSVSQTLEKSGMIQSIQLRSEISNGKTCVCVGDAKSCIVPTSQCVGPGCHFPVYLLCRMQSASQCVRSAAQTTGEHEYRY
jgi:hypothetical protein